VTAPEQAGRGRARTRQAILTAARGLFSELGYEQTTVRAVAHRAGVDPALVMKYFGSKDGLFDAVSEPALPFGGALAGPPEQLGERLLGHVLADLDGRPDRSMPVLRSMLTHPQAAETVRCAVADPGGSPVADALSGEEARLRAALVGTVVLGLLVSRYLLRVPEVEEATAERLTALLGPCLRPLLAPDADAPDTPDAPSAPAAGSPGPDPLRELAAAEAERLAAAERVDRLARAALAGGASFAEVGHLLGITRQAARKRWPREETGPAPSTT